MAADTIKLPGAGPVNRKVVLVAAAVGVGVVGYAWWTRKPEVPEEVVTEGELDAMGDERIPTTGVPYDPNIGAPSTGITTNAEWSQFATDRLLTLGYDPVAVAEALGKFLAHQPLTPAEANIARAALAQAGQPPQGGPWQALDAGPPLPPASVGMPAPILTSSMPAWRNGAWEYTIEWAPVPGAVRYWFQHVSGSSGYITATRTSTIRAAAGRTDTWKFAGVNAAGVKGPEATLAKPMPAAPGGGGTAGGRAPANPTLVLLTSLGANRYRVSAGPWIMVPANRWRVRWEVGSRVSPWATMPHSKDFVWKFTRGTRFRVRVQAGNSAGWSSPGTLSNTVTAR